jgi:hypothetical protein
MQSAQRLARLDAELLDEVASPIRVDRKGLRVPTAAVEREHQLCSQPFSQRMFRDQRLELRHEAPTFAESQIRLDPLLERDEPQLVEPGNRRLGPGLVFDVSQCGPAPERERGAESLCGLPRLLNPRLVEQPLEFGSVRVHRP